MFKKYYIFEIIFLIIAVCALGLAAFNTSLMMDRANARTIDVPASDTQVVALETVATAPDINPTPTLVPVATVVYPTPEGELEEEDEGEFEEEFDFYSVAAEAIGIDVETLGQELSNGKTIADVAKARGVDVQQVSQQLIAKEHAIIEAERQRNFLTQEETEMWKNEVEILTPFVVETGYREPEFLAMTMIGLEPDTFYEMMDSGKTVATMAAENNIDPQTIVDAIVTSENGLVDHLLSSALIDPGEVEEWKADNQQMAQTLVNQPFGGEDEEGEGMEEDEGNEVEDKDEE